jgi:threonine/homoserine/homoserine lactone efflux protein
VSAPPVCAALENDPMIDLAGALGFAAVSLAIALAPGPSWIYVISSTVRQGPKAGLVAVAGNATGIVCHVAAAALGLSAVLHYSATLYIAVKWIGALYLMLLAIRIIRQNSATALSQPGRDKKPLGRIYRDGVLVNVLNPKVSLLMLALLPQFVDPELGGTTLQIAMIGSLHVAIASCVLMLIVATVTRTAGMLTRNPKAEAALRWTTGTLLFGFGARMALAEAG